MNTESKMIPVNEIEKIMLKYAPLFEGMEIPEVYRDSKLLEYINSPVSADSEIVNISMKDDLGKNEVGRCITGRYAEYACNGVQISYPVFKLVFKNENGYVGEDTIIHEMIHMYINTYEFCYFVYNADQNEHCKEMEKQGHKIIAKGRNKMMQKLRRELNKVYSEAELFCLDMTYEYMKNRNMFDKSHDLLFYRISLMFDKMLGYQPGLTFGYGLDEMTKIALEGLSGFSVDELKEASECIV